MTVDLPLPPREFRHLVGLIEPAAFDDPSVHTVLRTVPAEAFESVLDYGCGCGRLARQLLRAGHAPRKYVGIDPHKGMIEWCRANITPHAPAFEFKHHDVFQEFMNPEGSLDPVPLPVDDGSVTLYLAWSVFTHLMQPDAEFSLRELSRVLHPSGIAITTWFIFDKTRFPMMQDSQNALYISDFDPTNAVIFDRGWLQRAVGEAGLRIVSEIPPLVPGHQWAIHLQKAIAPGSAR
jgi:SAM-dependent methyltransferase